MNHSALFQSQQINQLLLPNRLAVAPMTRVSASADGVAGERMRQYYQRFAQGEFGLIVSEGIYIDQAWSQSYEFQSGLVNEAQQRGWRQVTQAVHQHGGRIFAQLQHAGALSQGNRYRTQTVAPSALRPKGEQMTFYRGEGAIRCRGRWRTGRFNRLSRTSPPRRSVRCMPVLTASRFMAPMATCWTSSSPPTVISAMTVGAGILSAGCRSAWRSSTRCVSGLAARCRWASACHRAR